MVAGACFGGGVVNPKERLEQIHEERRRLDAEEAGIYLDSIRAAEPAEKVCPDSLAASMVEVFAERLERESPWPKQVEGVRCIGAPFEAYRPTERKPHPWVAIRPCEERFGNKTFFGILLGDLALAYSVYINKDGLLVVSPSMHNPAIYVPDLKEVVFGCGSWWGTISSPEKLREISDADIESVWYVRAMKDLEGSTP